MSNAVTVAPAPSESDATTVEPEGTEVAETTQNTAAPSAPRQERAGWSELPSRRTEVLHTAVSAMRELRFVEERPASLWDSLSLAKRGAWTTSQDGALRHLAVAHFWILQAPVITVGALLVWAGRTPGRLWTVLPLLMTLATAIHQIPAVGLLIPDFLTWPYWPPLSWFNRGDTP